MSDFKIIEQKLDSVITMIKPDKLTQDEKDALLEKIEELKVAATSLVVVK